MKPYSADLRERVLAAVQDGERSQAQIAQQFQISDATLEHWLRRQRETGHWAALPHGGGRPRTVQDCAAFIRTEIKKQPDVTLEELGTRVAPAHGVHASPSMMCRELQRLNLPRKETLHDNQRDTPRVKRLRREFHPAVRERVSDLLDHLKFIDEFGVHWGLTRLFGRATPGKRVVAATLGYSGAHTTVVATLSLQGIEAPWVFEGATTGNAFETYVEQVLAPTLTAGALALIDNLCAHKGDSISKLIEGCGATLQFLPPYSSDWNPIELCWSKVKTALRQAKARTCDALVDALCDALRAINPADVLAGFTHCGYALDP